MSLWNRPDLRGLLIAAAALAATPAAAQMELKIIAPAAPGGGWDQTARSMQQALVASGAAKSAQVINIPGAGGTVGLAQFVNSAKGDGNQLMVNGFVMVGAILTNKSPVSARSGDADRQAHRGDADHRGAGQFADQDRQGSGRRGEEGRRQGDVRRRLGRRRRPHHGGAVRRRGRRRCLQGQLRAVLRRRRVARRDPRRQGDRRHFRLRANTKARSSPAGCAPSASPRRSAFPASTCRPSRSRASTSSSPTGARWSAAPGISDGAEEGARRRRREDGEVAGLEGSPQAEGLGRRLSCRATPSPSSSRTSRRASARC